MNKQLKKTALRGNPAPNNWLFPEGNDYKPNDYTIVYGIITGKNTNRPKIPFFSKVIFRQIAITLTNQGYNVCLSNIAYARTTGTT